MNTNIKEIPNAANAHDPQVACIKNSIRGRLTWLNALSAQPDAIGASQLMITTSSVHR